MTKRLFQPSQPLRPYKVLAFLLYTPPSPKDAPWGPSVWIKSLTGNRVVVCTAEFARALRLSNKIVWDYMFWLKDQGLILDITKPAKRGFALITLLPPLNVNNRDKLGTNDE